MRVLITGAGSGFGKYLAEDYFKGHEVTSFNRGDEPSKVLAKPRFDLIVHCAVDARLKVLEPDLDSFFESNIAVASLMLDVPCDKLVFISSVDVYSENGKVELESPVSTYKFSKILSEILIRSKPNSLIIRPSSLLGPTMKPNTLTKVIAGHGEVRVSAESEYNCILYEDLAGLIQECVNQDIAGTLNAVSTQGFKLADLAVDSDIKFGAFTYKAPQVSGQTAYAIYPKLKKTSLEVIEQFTERFSHVATA